MSEIRETFSVLKFDAQKPPLFLEVKGKEWVSFGANNDYPYYLIDLYNRSAKHNAIINGKVMYVLGGGWESSDGDSENLKGFIERANPYESLDEVTRKVITDYELFDGFAIEVIWDRGGQSLASLSHVDFCNVRVNKEGSEFYYTKNWFIKGTDGSKRKNREPEESDDWQVYTPYSSLKKKGKQLLYVKAFRPDLGEYPLPSYIGAVQYIDVDTEIANYHYSNLKNGFSASYMLKFYNGVPTDEEKKKIEAQIKEKLAGSGNAGKFFLNFSDGKDRSAEIEVIPMSESDDQFQALNLTVQQELFSGHRVTSPMLFGIKTEGQLGGRTELIEANELFQNTYVRPRQQYIESIFASLSEDSGIKGELRLKKLEPIGIDYFAPEVWNVLSRTDKLERIGLDTIDGDGEKTLVDKLNSLTPIAAQKVIDTMTSEELRSLVGLGPAAGT